MAQPDVHAVNSELGIVLFDDGAQGTITTWVDPSGETHDRYVADAVSVVARHPGPLASPWFAIGLTGFGPAVIH
ncbi:hypothetical protein [uncultured Methylobacterium sp.]|jgi:hypothetical protein|uniref:hypothetical protein n=1 Tax=uncultured Methylobacterium sp. TaxID=157278 RepID=UPI00261B0B36|nr:hypothetical protein [uncultured Methylobacterium sp.]